MVAVAILGSGLNTLVGASAGAATEADRAERGILIVLSALRVGAVLQLAVVILFLVRDSSVPWTVVALAIGVIVFSAAYVGTSLRRGNMLSTRWGLADVLTGSIALVILSLTMPPPLHIGTWLDWAPGYLAPVAGSVPAWLKSTRGSLLTGAAIGVLYMACTLPGNEGQFLTVLINGSAYPLFSLSGALFAKYTRRLAANSDQNRRRAEESREEAIKATAALELARYSFHVHNATGLLEAFAKETLDPTLASSLRRQAAQEANRLRYEVLRGHQGEEVSGGPVRLEAVIWDATAGFGHLPLEFSLALGRNVPLQPRHALALKAAMVALLYNVQLHAQATTVTIHADQGDDRWEVTVNDDGVGFDPRPECFGFGLRTQVTESLERNQLKVTITSHKGEGTCTTISGPPAR
jgi:signal transduction histidine kinase